MDIDVASKLFPNLTTIIVQLLSTGVMFFCFKQFLIEKIVDCPVEQIGMGAYANIDGQYILDKAFSKISENYVS